jgi:hypothetical protein
MFSVLKLAVFPDPLAITFETQLPLVFHEEPLTVVSQVPLAALAAGARASTDAAATRESDFQFFFKMWRQLKWGSRCDCHFQAGICRGRFSMFR